MMKVGFLVENVFQSGVKVFQVYTRMIEVNGKSDKERLKISVIKCGKMNVLDMTS